MEDDDDEEEEAGCGGHGGAPLNRSRTELNGTFSVCEQTGTFKSERPLEMANKTLAAGGSERDSQKTTKISIGPVLHCRIYIYIYIYRSELNR